MSCKGIYLYNIDSDEEPTKIWEQKMSFGGEPFHVPNVGDTLLWYDDTYNMSSKLEKYESLNSEYTVIKIVRKMGKAHEKHMIDYKIYIYITK